MGLRRDGSLRGVASAGLLLVGIAVGAHIVWRLLDPVLPSLIASLLVLVTAYLFFSRRS